ncbi:MAG: stage II sporulation protein M [Candidatus Aenigmarchaeota archaeon]|nr:stage II sporulation protein M [Candidatus Aenigmarchaeota archaeon]
MFESILGFRDFDKRPERMFLWMFVWAVMITSIAIFIASQVSVRFVLGGTLFDTSGIFSVLFVIIPSAYWMTVLIKREETIEEKDIEDFHKKSFWEKHFIHLLLFLVFFAGVTIAFAAWHFFLDPNFFQVQETVINRIQGASGALTKGSFVDFERIFANNFQVMLFAFLFSLFFGAGAVFILVWNASILGVAIARISETVWHIPGAGSLFLTHGILEIGGYIVAGLAGSIISAAVLRKNRSAVLKTILFDSFKLLALAIVLIVVGAFVEVYL